MLKWLYEAMQCIIYVLGIDFASLYDFEWNLGLFRQYLVKGQRLTQSSTC